MAGLITTLALVIFIIVIIALFTPIHIIIESRKKDDETATTAALALPKETLKLEIDTKKRRMKISAFKKTLIDTHIKPEEKKEKKAQEEEKEKKKKKPQTQPKIKPLEFISPAFDLTESIIKSFHYEILTLNIDLGLSDPADTGIATGMFWAMKGAATPFTDPEKTTITMTPYFQQQRSDYEFHFSANETLYRILSPILIFLASRPVRKIIKDAILRRR